MLSYSRCVTPTVLRQSALLCCFAECVSLYFCSVVSLASMWWACSVWGGCWGFSLLNCHYLQGWVSEGCNDCLAVWVLKRSNHAQVIGLTSIWCVCVHLWVSDFYIQCYYKSVGLFLSLSAGGMDWASSVNIRNRNKAPGLKTESSSREKIGFMHLSSASLILVLFLFLL